MNILFFTSAILFLGSLNLQAATFAKWQITGTGCVKSSGEFRRATDSDPVYILPLNLTVKKNESTGLDRKACAASFAVNLATDEKLVVENISQEVKTQVDPGGVAKVQLEVFLAGQKSEILKAESTATTKTVNARLHLAHQGPIAESVCGGQLIVRANASAVATGAKVIINYDDLKLNLKAVKCVK